jgi:aerobic C4-dicarboxylate transport protein
MGLCLILIYLSFSFPRSLNTVKSLMKRLYFWVLVATFGGAFLGYWQPDIGVQLKPLGDGFIALVKMLISPIVFCTVVMGIAGAGDMKKVGRVGAKALLYFEVVSTLALGLGLVVMHIIAPGNGFHVDPQALDAKAVSGYVNAAQQGHSFVDFLMHLIPKTFVDAFTSSGDLLQVLLLAILFGYATMRMGKVGTVVHHFIEETTHIFFSMMDVIMKLAPIGVAGAMAFTLGKFGVDSLKPLLALMGTFYMTCALFVVVVLGLIAKWAGFSIFRFLAYIKDELLTVLGTSSSESVLVPLMKKLEKMGCSKSVVGLVIPSGYSFNLDGTNIYLTMAALFVAQALDVHLSLWQEFTLLGVAMLSSKGASGVSGAGFIILAATLAVVPSIPVQGLALILGIDRFMSGGRALTNLIGNGVAAVVIAKWENELDTKALNRELNG